MGHVANPLSLRMGWSQHWNTVWYSQNNNFYYIFDHIFQKFLTSFFFNKKVLKTNILFSQYIFVKKYNRLFLELFLFDPFFRTFKTAAFRKVLRKTKKFRKTWRIKRLKSKAKICFIL